MKVQLLMKRVIDIMISLVGLFVLMPLMLLIGFIVYRKLGWPFFIQERPGRNGRLFKMIKFRSMLNICEADGKLLHDEERLTPFGQALRSASIDELPELINVLKGEMSIVGPRPLLTEYLPLYNEKQQKRHLMRPGITGWAQINGRNTISWDEKFEYDVWYVENWSLLFDLKILFLTMWKVIKREGINQKKNLSMEMWTGNISE